MKRKALLLLGMGCAVGQAQFVTPPSPSLPGSSPAAIQLQGALVQSQLAAQYAMAQTALARTQISTYMAMARSQTGFAYMMAASGEASTQAAMRANLLRMRMANMSTLRAALQASSSPQAAAATAAAQTGSSPGSGSAATPVPQAGTPMMNFRPTSGLLLKIDKPSFSQEGGKVDAGTVVKIKTETHYSTIYYTTDGWTPTTSSPVYSGALTINATTHLQAMAIGPNLMRSPVSHIDYTVAKPVTKPVENAVMVPDGVLRAGTPLRLVTGGKEISSAEAGVGDKMTLLLDEDIKVGDAVAIAKGTKVDAVIMNADPVSGGSAGDLVFDVQSMKVSGSTPDKTIALSGGETMEGTDALLNKKEAVIKPGMTVVAFVAEDTPLKH